MQDGGVVPALCRMVLPVDSHHQQLSHPIALSLIDVRVGGRGGPAAAAHGSPQAAPGPAGERETEPRGS